MMDDKKKNCAGCGSEFQLEHKTKAHRYCVLCKLPKEKRKRHYQKVKVALQAARTAIGFEPKANPNKKGARKDYVENREKILARNAKYRAENWPKILEKRRATKAKNKALIFSFSANNAGGGGK